MELIEAIMSRKTIRGYKSTPVPKEILSRILEIATRAPSGVNCQPWEFTVLGGEVLDKLKVKLVEQVQLGVEPHPDFTSTSITGIFRKRRVEVGVALYQLLGIKREDTEKRKQWSINMRRVFNAPNLIIISIDEEIAGNFSAILSLGTVMQSICLVALEYGLGTTLIAAVIEYPEVIREITNIPNSKKLAIAIAIGYPDWEAIANKLETTREPVDKITTWMGI